MTQQELIVLARKDTEETIARIENVFLNADAQLLQKKPAPKSWSAVECFSHLLKANKYYLDGCRKALAKHHTTAKPEAEVAYSLLGKIFLSFVEPAPEGTAPKRKVPAPGMIQPHSTIENPEALIEKFISQQKAFLALLQEAEKADLNAVRVPSLLGSLFKFRLGDVLRLLSWHTTRHTDQAERAMNS